MSGIYIKGMEMPTSCDGCWALDDNGDYPRCRITDEQRGYNFHVREKRMDKCPLVPVPEHGRLIDADALEELVIKQKYDCAGASAYGAITELHKSWGLHDAELMIEAAPTIIPADHIGDINEMVADKEGDG